MIRMRDCTPLAFSGVGRGDDGGCPGRQYGSVHDRHPILGVNMDSTADSLSLVTSVLLGECWRSILEKPRAKSLYLYIRAAGKTGNICPTGGQAER